MSYLSRQLTRRSSSSTILSGLPSINITKYVINNYQSTSSLSTGASSLIKFNTRDGILNQQVRNNATIPSPSSIITGSPSLPNIDFMQPIAAPVPQPLHQSIGQPSHLTHPHLIKEGQVTVGVSKAEFDLRRTMLMATLPANSIVVVMGHRLKYRSNNIFYPFHQNPNLYYLTGFDQPDAALILTKQEDSSKPYHMALFVPPKDPAVELWEGAKCGIDNAKSYFGADEAHDNVNFAKMLKPKLTNAPFIYLDMPKSIEVNSPEHSITNFIYQNRLSSKVKYLRNYTDELRLIKSSAEVSLMKRACDIAAYSFIKVMEKTGEASRNSKALSEHDIASEFEAQSRSLGSQGHAYVPVVAGGSNALALHYVSNDQLLRPQDFLMMDAGSSYFGYGSDVTRTWPVSGKFSPAQKELYQAVLNVQKECIKLCVVDSKCSLNDILFHSIDLLHKELRVLGFNLTRNEVHDKLYPHHISHYLGLDVHDTPTSSRSQKLRAGMIVTVEPGVYVPHDSAYPERFRGMGIRIEDDVLVTDDDSPIVLSASAPKEIVDVEFACSGARSKSPPILF